MTYANAMKQAAIKLPREISTDSAPVSGETQANQALGWRRIFFRPGGEGPGGLRAGWRLLIFLGIMGSLVGCLYFIGRATHGGQVPKNVTFTPALAIPNEAVMMTLLCLATWIMAKLERRSFNEFGLPLRRAFGSNFWVGTAFGFGAISTTLLTMYLMHGFQITGMALQGKEIFLSLGGWGLAYILSALFEEFGFRGYVQFTLGSGIGFWPAAVLFSTLFGVGHYLADSNETVLGSTSVILFGLLLCFFLRRTGDLWCAIGFHMAYDLGQIIYGVPDSGIVPYHNLLNSTRTGPQWLTGGSVGPEASVLTPIALLAVAAIFTRIHRSANEQKAFG